ncbi:MAG: phage tail assembly protein [Piscinibacter sp.]|uniref:phage tail assembly protein n=1 Tax=Piscinibacter sp. TaxID=1903157 RepID=UPI00258A79E4|nr:phage tail assembly protein [Piscinibacter sp.]MCW5666474.1 phage tail assembly protein [Piscinibacter sp.]
MSDTIDYTLKVPVEVKTAAGNVVERIEKVTLKRLLGREVRQALNSAKGGGNGDVSFALLAASASLPPSTLDQFEAVDVLQLLDLSSAFVGGPSS